MKKKSVSQSTNRQAAIQFQNVAKSYTLKHQKPTLVGTLFGLESRERFQALRGISLTISQGEKVGIIGPNGSGKTTLLKIAAGIATPDSGKVVVKGKVVSLIELEAGFHPELTGEENIFLNGLIIGMAKEEIEQNFTQIVQFSGLKKFIDSPLYTYSSGMSLRLGFSIAVHSNPDILLLDEAIAVGDQEFREKSLKKINSFFKQGKTIVSVSHWLDYLKNNCTRIIWLEQGKVVEDGGIEVIELYKKDSEKA
ncbi:MAG: Teichoic-acid-transporting ATPase [Candidatus Pacebacteria bacterium GW2011_GWA1_46_10]|nr:MAG: Teichoic-acid-transporting ATPase [Candidatus Pacebacteria bacterium GW2011_GWA1_46_10]HCR80987.1 ABC transporter ATP-binding protein [Candidatus Paceibacterota bacterium]